MGSSELAEWMVFWKMEPWGSYRDNIHAGLIAATIANVNRKPHAKPISHEVFMLTDQAKYKRNQSRETLAWMSAVAKKVNRG